MLPQLLPVMDFCQTKAVASAFGLQSPRGKISEVPEASGDDQPLSTTAGPEPPARPAASRLPLVRRSSAEFVLLAEELREKLDSSHAQLLNQVHMLTSKLKMLDDLEASRMLPVLHRPPGPVQQTRSAFTSCEEECNEDEQPAQEDEGSNAMQQPRTQPDVSASSSPLAHGVAKGDTADGSEENGVDMEGEEFRVRRTSVRKETLDEKVERLDSEKRLRLRSNSMGAMAEKIESHSFCSCLRRRRLQQLRKELEGDMVGAGLFKEGTKESRFDVTVACAIILNVLVIMLRLQWEGHKAGVLLGLESLSSFPWQGAGLFFNISEHVFNTLFFFELVARIYCMGWSRFAKETSNIFDLLLVVVSTVELYILQPLQIGVGANITFLRIVRFFKLFRVLRLVRVMKLFRDLRILVQTVAASMVAVGWSMALMSMIIIASALFLCQLLQEVMLDEAFGDDLRRWVFYNYGSSTRATYTLFEATFSGCWPNYSRKMVDEINPLYSVFWILYIAGAVFAITRIISATFVKETLNVAGQQSDLMVYERMRNKDRYVKQLKQFFIEADQSGDGKVDRDEFDEIMSNPKVLAWLQALELEVHETYALFNLIDDGDGEISCDEFLQGVVRLKGQARCVDVVAILRDVSRIHSRLEQLNSFIYDQFGVEVPPPVHKTVEQNTEDDFSDAG